MPGFWSSAILTPADAAVVVYKDYLKQKGCTRMHESVHRKVRDYVAKIGGNGTMA